MLAVCVLAQAVPFWALAEGEESEKITPTPAEQEGEEAASTQDDQAGQAQPAPTPAEAQEPQPEGGLLSAPQPRAGVTKEVRCLDGDGSEKTQTATEDDDVENGSPNSLTIYGQQEGTGALTATAAANTGNAGIGGGTFGGDQRGSGSFSLSGSGVVFAEYIQDKSGEDSWQGLVFAGGEGQVYGDSLTLAQSLTIPQGSTLYIPQGSTLTVPELINEGILFNFGTLNAGSLENTGTLYSMQELAGATPISLQSGEYLDQEGRTQTRADLIPLNEDMNRWFSGWYLVTGEVALTQRVQVKGGCASHPGGWV